MANTSVKPNVIELTLDQFLNLTAVGQKALDLTDEQVHSMEMPVIPELPPLPAPGELQ